MKTIVTEQTETNAKLTVTLEEAELKPVVAAAYAGLRTRVKAAGFRPGKAPDYIVERELGTATVHNEVLEQAVATTYAKAINEQKLRALGRPQVQVTKFVPYMELEYQVEVDLMPEVKLGEYKKIRLKQAEVKVEDSEIEATLQDLRRRQAARIDSQQPAKLGDEVVFDFKGTRAGKEVPGASAERQTLRLGDAQFIPGFEEQIVGLKAGDTKTFDITFPADYHEASLQGQVVQFNIKLHKVTELALPEVDTEFVQAVSPFKTTEELRADIRQRISGQKEEAAAREFEQKLLDKILDNSQYQVPKSLLEQQLSQLKGELAQRLASSGLDLPKYLEMVKKTEPELEDELRPEAEKRVGLALVLTEVAKAEQIEVGDTLIDEEISRLKSQYPDPQMQAELEAAGTREEVYNHLMASRVIAKLTEYATSK